MKNLFYFRTVFYQHVDSMAALLLKHLPQSFFGSEKVLREKMNKLYGEESYSEQIHLSKKKLAAKFYILLLIFLFFLTTLTLYHALARQEIHAIIRPQPAEGKELHTFRLEIKEGDMTYAQDLSIHVSERERTNEEIHALLKLTEGKIKEAILNQNEDLNHIYSDLNLYTVDEETGVNLKWKSLRKDLINNQGQVYSTFLEQEEAATLEFELSMGKSKQKGSLNLKVVPFMEYASLKEIMSRKLNLFLTDISQDKRASSIKLPEAFGSIKVRWYKKGDDFRGLLIVFFVIGLLLLHYTKYSSLNKRIKKNKEEIEKEYPHFISKLVLLLSTGLIFQSAIEKIVFDYKAQSSQKKYFYNQLSIMMHNVEESKAYLMDELNDFSKRCGVKELMRFAVIIKENLMSGDLLSEKLGKEAEEVWKNRKRKAEELGKLAETKLVFPMVLLLLVLIMIVMMPAFLEMK